MGAELLVIAAAVYALAGLLFGGAFVTVGVGQLDAAARGTPITFRALILPGCVALWPLLAAKWIAHERSHR